MVNGGLEEKLSLIRKFLFGFASVAGVIFFVWGLLYSVYFANINFVIFVRNGYQNLFLIIEKDVFLKEREIGRSNQIYTFHIDKSDDSDNYTYSYWGEVVRFDAEKNIIYLSDEGKNKEYAFLVAGDKENTMAQVSNYLGLRWEDERTLRQILQDGKKLDLPLNIDSPIIFPPKR